MRISYSTHIRFSQCTIPLVGCGLLVLFAGCNGALENSAAKGASGNGCADGSCVLGLEISGSNQGVETGALKGESLTALASTDNADLCANGACDGDGPSSVLGITCKKPSACPSGFCVDGYCCDSECGGTCMACNVGGKVGTCSPVPVFQDDGNAWLPCVGATLSCNGSGACKAELGAPCANHLDCISGYCASGVCSPLADAPGPIAWEWHSEELPVARPDYGFVYGDVSLSAMVVRDDGRVRISGSYINPMFGMPSGSIDEQYGNQYGYYHSSIGPHPYSFNLDASGQTATFQNGGIMTSGWDKHQGLITTFRTYTKGMRLWVVAGDLGGSAEYWRDDDPPGGPLVATCLSAGISKVAPPAWTLGTVDVCPMQALQIDGNTAGNTLVRHATGVTMYDPAGQVALAAVDPFPGMDGDLKLTPQDEMILGERNNSNIRLAKANAAGTLQWTTTIVAPMSSGAQDCFSYAVDTLGNIVLAFHSSTLVNLGNGSQPIGLKDLILAKFEPVGKLMWAKRFGTPGFVVNSCRLQRTGTQDVALLLDYAGFVDFGDGTISLSPVLVKFDALGLPVWHADLSPHFPFVVEPHAWFVAGHPSGAAFVASSAHAPSPMSTWQPRRLRFVVAKYGP